MAASGGRQEPGGKLTGYLHRQSVVSLRPRRAGRLGAALLLAAALTGCGGSGTKPAGDGSSSAGGQGGPASLLLVSYSVTKSAYDRILPKFEADWKRSTGQAITVKTSYGGSGSQTRAVIDGLPADVVGLALVADVYKLQDKDLIDVGWEKEFPNQSIITNSTVALFCGPAIPRASRAGMISTTRMWM